jgi:ATP-binding cassette, subfamily G (WHITE), member 2, SNQ2
MTEYPIPDLAENSNSLEQVPDQSNSDTEKLARGKELDWNYSSWLHTHEQQKAEKTVNKTHLALTWQNLAVTGVDSKAVLGSDIFSHVNPVEHIRGLRNHPKTITILKDFNGQVRPGEMLLVLGRPGSGCTTFLSAVANKRKSFLSVEGNVFYGAMSHTEARRYKGAVIYNSEG